MKMHFVKNNNDKKITKKNFYLYNRQKSRIKFMIRIVTKCTLRLYNKNIE